MSVRTVEWGEAKLDDDHHGASTTRLDPGLAPHSAASGAMGFPRKQPDAWLSDERAALTLSSASGLPASPLTTLGRS